jgi:ribosomal protein S18 acetylase RimI-like enzyme
MNSETDSFMTDVVIRNAAREDVVQLISAHKRLGLGMMSKLSPNIIAFYYRNALELPNFVCRTLWQGEAFVGFYQINTDLGIPRTAPFFLRRVDLVRALIKSPASLFLMLRHTLTRIFLSGPSAPTLAPRDCELIYIGVLKEFQGRGHGTSLIADMKKYLQKFGKKYLVFEVFKDDPKVLEFYRRFSAEILGEIQSPGVPGYLMRIRGDRMPD